MDDRQFMINFMGVIAGLVVLGVIVFILAIWIGGESERTSDPITNKVIDDRIKPVGEVYVGNVPAEALKTAQKSAQPGASTGGPKFASGKEVYEAVCLACHATGAAGAPKYGDKGAWAKYLEKGIEGSYKAAIGGAGAMPAKGGRADLADEDVKSAVDYIFEGLQ